MSEQVIFSIKEEAVFSPEEEVIFSVSFSISSDGAITAGWWSKEASEILCELCGECTPEKDKPLDCLVINSWCG